MLRHNFKLHLVQYTTATVLNINQEVCFIVILHFMSVLGPRNEMAVHQLDHKIFIPNIKKLICEVQLVKKMNQANIYKQNYLNIKKSFVCECSNIYVDILLAVYLVHSSKFFSSVGVNILISDTCHQFFWTLVQQKDLRCI